MSRAPGGRVRKGDRITADRANAEADAIRSGRVRPSAGVTVNHGSLGTTVAVLDDDSGGAGAVEWCRITEVGTGASAGLYGWQGVRGDGTATGWVDVESRKGTLTPEVKRPLLEVNLYPSIPIGKHVWYVDDPGSARVETQFEACP